MLNECMLGPLNDEQKVNWKNYVAPLVHAYNTTRHESTNYSPHFLMFGWHPTLSPCFKTEFLTFKSYLVLCLLLALSAALEAVLYANCNLFSNCRAYVC
jgi:hypothetical protein